MKKLILFGLLTFVCTTISAQVISSDSVAYQLQRQKINNMLAARTLKFGQYDQSLSKHTGIFGLQTKKDIRRSNEILMDIVKTDNEIYKQLKILLDYRTFQLDDRTFQQKQLLDQSKEIKDNALAYMRTINRLREDNDKMKAQLEKNARLQQKTTLCFIISVIVLLAGILFLYKQRLKKV